MIERIFKFYKRPLVQDTLKTTIWSTIGKAVGFLIPFFIAAWFGVGGETDAFFFAYGLILFLSGIFAPVVESVIVPYIAEARAKDEDVGKFIGSILSVGGAGLFVLTVLLILAIGPILSIITHFDEQTLRLIFQILLETAPLVILLVWTSVLAGALNTYKKFAFPAISPAFRAIVNLIIIFTFKNSYGVHSIALGYIVGELVRLAILFTVIKKLNLFKLRLSFQLDHKLGEFFKTSSYRVVGMIAGSFNLMLDKIMASWLGEGNVSILYYASRLYVIPVTMICVGLLPVILSHWSEDYYQEEEKGRLLQEVTSTAKFILGPSLIVFLILVLFNRPLVHLAFAHGEFDLKYLPILHWAFICYLFGLIPYVASSMFTRAHLVLKNTSFLMKLAILSCFLNALLNYTLMQFLGIVGIALSTSIAGSVTAILLFISIRKA